MKPLTTFLSRIAQVFPKLMCVGGPSAVPTDVCVPVPFL